jgi:hypothetical protein
LPFELRALAKANQTRVYSLLFDCAVSTLKCFGVNDKHLAAKLAMTTILHTHTRTLDYHPHVHIVIPGGGVANNRTRWREVKGKYLFNEFNLAAVFRGKLLFALEKSGLQLPKTPKKWVAHCKHVGRGLPALQYLSRYLYRGVISNNNLVSDDGILVTFRYKDSKTGQLKRRQLPGEDFLQLLLQHTLPKGFRRARDYGFLHGNAKRILTLVQLVLKVAVLTQTGRLRPKLICKICSGAMSVLNVDRDPYLSG